MKKFFNIAGPCHPNKHYMLPTQERCQGLLELIEQEQYFVIHAARQTGKTTLLLELAKQLNESGDYYALYCSLETVQGIVDAEKGIPAIIKVIKNRVTFQRNLKALFLLPKRPIILRLPPYCSDGRLDNYVSEALDKPLVILFDEVDCLSNGTLISFLRQLRNGYIERPDIPFVHSIALVGMRNIRDYKGQIREPQQTLGSSSPFNIVKTSKTLRRFTEDEITKLYAQHTQQAGQTFPPKVVQRVFHYTQGQPWLVNAIACEIVEQILGGDETAEILPKHVEQAVQTLIIRRDTHIDSLMERLKEARVQKIVEPVILGENKRYELLDDDYQYVLDLGLLREEGRQLLPSNPIYGEIIIRTLSFRSQQELEDISSLPAAPAYLVDGKLDMKRLLGDFQQFWRQNSESWTKRYQYVEAAPHLTLQAFLQKIVNSGGRISREMASGAGRLDLYIHYQGFNYPIELKIRYSDTTSIEGRKQLAKYMDKLGCTEGWLIVFDKRKKVSWEKKIFWQTRTESGKTIHIIGA